MEEKKGILRDFMGFLIGFQVGRNTPDSFPSPACGKWDSLGPGSPGWNQTSATSLLWFSHKAPSLTPVERGGRASALFALVMAGLTGFSEFTFMWKWAVSCSNHHF